MIFKQFRHLSAALALSFASAAAGSDVALVGAYEAYLSGDALKFSRQAKYLEGHLLEPWVEYWRLSMRLEDAQAPGLELCRGDGEPRGDEPLALDLAPGLQGSRIHSRDMLNP